MRRTIMLLICFMIHTVSYACDCDDSNSFCETISSQSTEEEYIVSAVKLGDIAHGMDIKIINSYRANILEDTIRVWGDPGWYCRPYTEFFEIGDTMIMKLEVINEIDSVYKDTVLLAIENIGDYELSICGTFYLEIKNDVVKGKISPETNEMSLDLFEALISEETFFAECTTSSAADVTNHQNIILYPNPLYNELSIISSQAISSVTIYNSSGQKVYSQSEINNKKLTVNVNKLELGFYFIEINDLNKNPVVQKIFKN